MFCWLLGGSIFFSVIPFMKLNFQMKCFKRSKWAKFNPSVRNNINPSIAEQMFTWHLRNYHYPLLRQIPGRCPKITNGNYLQIWQLNFKHLSCMRVYRVAPIAKASYRNCQKNLLGNSEMKFMVFRGELRNFCRLNFLQRHSRRWP